MRRKNLALEVDRRRVLQCEILRPDPIGTLDDNLPSTRRNVTDQRREGALLNAARIQMTISHATRMNKSRINTRLIGLWRNAQNVRDVFEVQSHYVYENRRLQNVAFKTN